MKKAEQQQEINKIMSENMQLKKMMEQMSQQNTKDDGAQLVVEDLISKG